MTAGRFALLIPVILMILRHWRRILLCDGWRRRGSWGPWGGEWGLGEWFVGNEGGGDGTGGGGRALTGSLQVVQSGEGLDSAGSGLHPVVAVAVAAAAAAVAVDGFVDWRNLIEGEGLLQDSCSKSIDHVRERLMKQLEKALHPRVNNVLGPNDAELEGENQDHHPHSHPHHGKDMLQDFDKEQEPVQNEDRHVNDVIVEENNFALEII